MEKTPHADELSNLINAVVEARRIAQIAVGNKKLLLEEWEEKYNGFLADLKLSIEAVSEAEAKLRELALVIYQKTNDKQVAAGIVIKVMTKLNYDGKVAFDWAKAHKMALKLDTKAFEKIAKADPPDFVKMTEEPLATIATELKRVEAEK